MVRVTADRLSKELGSVSAPGEGDGEMFIIPRRRVIANSKVQTYTFSVRFCILGSRALPAISG